MCGIAGILNFQGHAALDPAELQRMAAFLAHRGPDDAGIYLDPTTARCGLAHRRLAVIDPNGGAQPLANHDNYLWIAYNGECYNFPDLRDQFQRRGHRFRTRSDTEVVLRLYQEYGPKCVDHIRGMFALAIWDQTKQHLFLARDRLGQKPLYYACHQGRFIFASECKAILQTKDFPRRPDHAAITQYLLLQYVPHPRTAFADIAQLPPAHTLTITADNYTCPTPKRYWSVPTEPTFQSTPDDAAQQVRHQLAEATRLRMISDVPLGAFLSGGLDSTIIVGLMANAQTAPIKTCSIGFTEDKYNELPFARIAARRFACDHHEHVVTPDCLDAIKTLSYHYDDPFADSSALPTYYLARLARSHVTVALSGDGGDECFAGYDRYRALPIAQRINRSKILSWLARRRIWQHLPSGDFRSRTRRLQRLLTAAALPIHRCYLSWMAVFDPDMIAQLLTPTIAADAQLWETFAPFFQSPAHPAAQAMLADANTYLPGDLNTKTDRAAMAVGLELRCPFQDHKLIELAYSLPTHYRYSTKQAKPLLHHACRDLIPPQIAARDKAGFGVPLGRWFRGQLRELFIDTVLSKTARQRPYFQPATLENLLAQNDSARHDHGHRLWSLLMLELWHRNYIDQIPTSTLAGMPTPSLPMQ